MTKTAEESKAPSTRKPSKPSGKSPENKAREIVADYNGYDYKKIFWEDADREYEDLADRLAIRRLLPDSMDSFVDVAGGYGRLADEYLGRAKKCTIFDYSKTELADAKKTYGDRISTKSGDIYDLPFADETFDGLMMIRATHHFKDMEKVVSELYRILTPGGVAVIEVANKKTLPKIVRYWTKKSEVNPFDKSPSKIDGLTMYNYHPKYIENLFENAGFKTLKILSVSNFRSTKLKKLLGSKTLIKLEKPAQKLLAPVRFAPSIYYKLEKPKQ